MWEYARPQEGSSYWKKWTNFDRIINFAMPVKNIMCHVRAFGLFESLVLLNNHTALSVKHALGWVEFHEYPPGHIVSVQDRTLVIAAADGFIGIIEWQFAAPDIMADIQSQFAKQSITFEQRRA